MIMKRLWHMLTDRDSFRVIYGDKQRTRRLNHSHAKSLKEIFGGKIIFDQYKI